MELEKLFDWVRQDPEKFRRLLEAERKVETGSIRIHYHNRIARKIEVVLAPEAIERDKKDLTNQESCANTVTRHRRRDPHSVE